MTNNPANTPASIKALREEGRVLIDWADGHKSEFDAAALRLLCPCAHCQGEAGVPGWLSTNPALTAQQTQLVNMHMIGQYAIAPVWGDGHDTGYYTFESLRRDCPCAGCTAAHDA
jgi:DUF971 family protein